jgi:hypothetical protein
VREKKPARLRPGDRKTAPAVRWGDQRRAVRSTVGVRRALGDAIPYCTGRATNRQICRAFGNRLFSWRFGPINVILAIA